MKVSEIRMALKEKFGSRKYRITSAEEIHVYGVMPNTNKFGWYFFGFIGDYKKLAWKE